MPKQELEQKKPEKHQEEEHETLVRILGYDVPGSRNIMAGLTRIKGVSWALSNAICISLNIDKSKKISGLSKDEIKKIEGFILNPQIPDFMKNRRKDPETGLTTHQSGVNLEMKKEFDIKRMKKMKSYKGIRHSLKQPVRGQRTRSHFRSRGKAVGVTKKAK